MSEVARRSGGARPPIEVIVEFVGEHRTEFGVEFICTQPQGAASSYYAAKYRQVAPSVRAVRDVLMRPVPLTLWIANRKVYGAHNLWKAARRAGHGIGRDQVARLMRQLGIERVSRLRTKVFTTGADPDAPRAPGLVNRHFTADRPDALWSLVEAVDVRELAHSLARYRESLPAVAPPAGT